VSSAAEVDFIGADDGAGGRKGGAHPVAVGGMDVRGEVLERDLLLPWQAPEVASLLVHKEAIRIDVPGPEGDARRIDGEPQMINVPDGRRVVGCHV
jgi:hypothetical protein